MSHFLNRQRRPYDWSWLSNHTSRSIIFCYVISISFHTFVFYVRCRQNYAFFLNPPRKSQEICKLSANYHKTSTSIILSTFSKAVPARTTWRKPLMVRQPYSEAVPSTGGRFSPSLLRFLSPKRGTEGVVKTWRRPR